jgi:hypothetical protein
LLLFIVSVAAGLLDESIFVLLQAVTCLLSNIYHHRKDIALQGSFLLMVNTTRRLEPFKIKAWRGSLAVFVFIYVCALCTHVLAAVQDAGHLVKRAPMPTLMKALAPLVNAGPEAVALHAPHAQVEYTHQVLDPASPHYVRHRKDLKGKERTFTAKWHADHPNDPSGSLSQVKLTETTQQADPISQQQDSPFVSGAVPGSSVDNVPQKDKGKKVKFLALTVGGGVGGLFAAGLCGWTLHKCYKAVKYEHDQPDSDNARRSLPEPEAALVGSPTTPIKEGVSKIRSSRN